MATKELMRIRDMEYVSQIPQTIPAGRILVHNRVHPVACRGGVRDSRFWLAGPSARYVVCHCGWAPA